MQDSHMAEFLTLHTTTFVMLDPRNFEFVGSIPEALLKKVLLDNAIIRAYRKMPSSGVRPIPTELKKIIYEGDKPKRGGKRKDQVSLSKGIKVTKKSKKPILKPQSPSPVFQDQSEGRTKSDVQGNSILRNNQEDTTHTSEPNPVESIHKLSSPPSSSIPTFDIFDSIIREPFLNLTLPPPPPPFNPPPSQITI